MELARPQLPRLDLPSHRAVNLELFIFYTWSDQIAELFDPLLGGKVFISRRLYSRRKHKHLVAVAIQRIEEAGESGLVVRLTYDASDRVQSLAIRREENREEAAITRLLRIPESPPIGITMAFQFTEADPTMLWFPLPSRIRGSADDYEIFEIRGVRGVKLANEEVGVHDWEYLFTLERLEGEEVFVSLHFDVNLPFDPEIPVQALEQGVAIARHLTGDATSQRGAGK